MKRTIIRNLARFILPACLFFACGKQKQEFTISGEIADATHQTLYLENVGATKIITLDSAQLTNGTFRFKHARPATPDFYRLRLGNQVINLAIDSTETIGIKSDTLAFAKNYRLEGDAGNSLKIQELTLLQARTAQAYHALQKQHAAGEIPVDSFVRAATAVINDYKAGTKSYILAGFGSLPAYFAMFQQIDNLLIFDPYNKEDNKLLGAVANAWYQAYPESPRAVQLKNLYTGALATLREKPASVEIDETSSAVLFDINLPAIDDHDVRLSTIAQDKVTLIDFTAYEAGGSPLHNLQLAELYNKYKSQGLEIYQISLDTDEHLWKNAAVNLPWYCVRDAQLLDSQFAQRYNVQRLPTSYIRNRNGEIVAKIEDYSTLNAEVANYVKK